ncbi:carboxypeptidase B2 [Iris pallida]|uniref:Carboxypeptidase B2 n=1 Tax=Iris pallida TaxID=29817 RepID=A0AAX6EDZ2_IRIPA|nr:carboxypeptidase B2 [Iris pallida]
MGNSFLISPSLFCSFLLLSSVSVDGVNSSSPFADLYHSSRALLEEVEQLVGRHRDRFTLETMRAQNKGYAAEIAVITYNRLNKLMNGDSKFRILLSFGQHGRELITSELALHLLSVLSGELGMPDLNTVSMDNVLDNVVIKIVPMENQNGRKRVEDGDACERRNGRGVDLNRNWSVDWGKKEKDYDPYEENPGIAPFSEPEAQIMRNITKLFDPHIWVTVHSGMEALFMPYDHRNGTPDGYTSKTMKSVLADLNHKHFRDRCVVGSGGGTVGYFAHGTTTDYMYDVAKVPVAFTFEIYGNSSAPATDCFRMFNPADSATFKKVISEWCTAFLTLFETAPSHLKADLGKWVSIRGNVVDGGESRPGRRKVLDGIELGMQELKTYFRLFILSSVLLMFMFCSRISRSKLIHTGSSNLS